MINKPKVIALRMTLARSKRCPEAGVRGKVRAPMATANAPSGTLTRNSQCQEATARIAAATLGPAADETATTSAVLPTPRPSRLLGEIKRTSAILTLITPAAPRPCATRAAVRSDRDGDKAQTR